MRMQIYAFFGIYPIKSDKNKRICDSVCAIFAYTAEGGEEMYPPKNRGIGVHIRLVRQSWERKTASILSDGCGKTLIMKNVLKRNVCVQIYVFFGKLRNYIGEKTDIGCNLTNLSLNKDDEEIDYE